ncbi:hypothetical protein diail_10955 [Diaporthe ilicicola]|nr:hypothetical protein diail_10955 [Diaporthe ilicicola]
MSSRSSHNNAASRTSGQGIKQAVHPLATGKTEAPDTKRSKSLETGASSTKLAQQQSLAKQEKHITAQRQGIRPNAAKVEVNPTKISQVTQRGHATNSAGGDGSKAAAPQKPSVPSSAPQKTITTSPPRQSPSDKDEAGGNIRGVSGNSGEAASNQLSQTLSIVIFRGNPIDAYIYRHVGLFIQTFNGDTLIKWNFLHVTGTAGSFQREESWDRNPLQSASTCGHVHVVKIRVTSETDKTLRNTIWATLVKNNDRSWNCQNWVGDALQRCVDARCISRAQMDAAIDKMADVLVEAPDTAD